jgi:hypothetical protein
MRTRSGRQLVSEDQEHPKKCFENLLKSSLMFLSSNVSVYRRFTHMVLSNYLLLFYFNQDRLDDILCSLRYSIVTGKMKRLDELENLSIYIVVKLTAILKN